MLFNYLVPPKDIFMSVGESGKQIFFTEHNGGYDLLSYPLCVLDVSPSVPHSSRRGSPRHGVGWAVAL